MNENGTLEITKHLSMQGCAGQTTMVLLIEAVEGCVCMTLNMGCGYV